MKNKEQVVFALSRPSRCFACDRKLECGEIVRLADTKDDREVQCKTCAGLDRFKILTKGNSAITRLAKKYSAQSFVIMKWDETWKCYERQGLLVEPEALERAKAESI